MARESLIPFEPLFPAQAEEALAIFKALRVVDLPGKPTFGECCEQWVFDFVAAIFGSYDADTGKQLIREFFLLISKKNAKSTIAAGVMLTAVILCWRQDEEHLIIAPTKEVADNSFKPAAGMVRADEELSSLFHIQDNLRTITHRVSRASLKVVAADAETVSGKKSGKILIDEMWMFGKRSNADAMLMEATGGQVSRDEGWVIKLTTQSDEPPAGVFKSDLERFRGIRDGTIVAPKALGLLYEFPDAMVESKAYLDPANFYVTNPNLGRSVSAEWLADKLVENEGKDDGALQTFLAKHLNIEIGLGLKSRNWAGALFWEQQEDKKVTFEAILRDCEVVTAGIDGGGLDDLLGLSIVGRHKDTGSWMHWAHAWAHPIVLDRRKKEAARLRDFERDGDLTIVERVGDDIEGVIRYLQRVEDAGLLERVGCDPSAIGGIHDALIGMGLTDERIVGIPQGWKLVSAIKTLERKLAECVFVHGGRRLMAWCVGNARVDPRGNAIVITKQASGFAKIDPLMATFNAVALMALNPAPVRWKIHMFSVGA